MMNASLSRFAKYSWVVLAYNIFVILFGAFVRATGSGAGCGAHWPLCNGVAIPRPERIETIIEFTHRITSGLTILLIIGLVIWAWRAYPKGSLVRVSTAFTGFFIITEALIGAGLVLFRMVEYNDSVARALWMIAHLVNTFLLLASLTATAWWATRGVPERIQVNGLTGGVLVVGLLAILVLGASGAVTALGDTLFRSESLAEGLAQDFSPTAHWLLRMRIYHPAIAVSVGVYLYLATAWVRRKYSQPDLETLTNILFALFVLQILLGILNVALLAPVWLQIVHLLVSNLVWISYVLLATIFFGGLAPRLGHQQIDYPVNTISGEKAGNRVE